MQPNEPLSQTEFQFRDSFMDGLMRSSDQPYQCSVAESIRKTRAIISVFHYSVKHFWPDLKKDLAIILWAFVSAQSANNAYESLKRLFG